MNGWHMQLGWDDRFESLQTCIVFIFLVRIDGVLRLTLKVLDYILRDMFGIRRRFIKGAEIGRGYTIASKSKARI